MKLFDWMILVLYAAMLAATIRWMSDQRDDRVKVRNDRRDELMQCALSETRDEKYGGWRLRTPAECVERYDGAARALGYDPNAP